MKYTYVVLNSGAINGLENLEMTENYFCGRKCV